jgi:glutathione S-transferase
LPGKSLRLENGIVACEARAILLMLQAAQPARNLVRFLPALLAKRDRVSYTGASDFRD